jgi:peptide maturation system acyl carrier-related protein
MSKVSDITATDSKLKEIFRNRLGVDFDKLQKKDPGILDKSLLGKELQLAPRELLYIFFDVENGFSIKVSENNVLSGFNTFNNILNCINQAERAV